MVGAAMSGVPIPNPKDLVDAADKLGLIQTVKGVLFRQPDPAAAKLTVVLSELDKIFIALEQEVVQLLSLTFDSAAEIKASRDILLQLESDASRGRLRKARGHCKKIWNIYRKYLDPWFQRVLNSKQQSKMEALFLLMDATDGMMVNLIDDAATWLGNEARSTRALVDKKDFQGAAARVSAAGRQILPVRMKISDAMRKLLEIEGDIVQASGAV